MKNILLVCSAGMSTSLLVTKMKEAAQKKNVEVNIWAVGDAEASDNVGKADIVLLGPQVRFLLSKVEKMVDGQKPVRVIDMVSYGTMNGEKVLETALEVLDA